jgi:alkyldihydroxyacetonephosphate synthase
MRKPLVILPSCVVFPHSAEEVSAVLLLANEEKAPVVPYGGGSGLMGGALSLQPGIVLDLSKMDGVLDVDRESRATRVQAGIVLESLNTRLEQEGLMLGHDPWTLPVATVGGAISTNSLGYRGAKYGSMGDQILGLEAVLPLGKILRTRAVPKTSTGIRLSQLFIGAEGCFGVVTEATVRVFPVPEKRSLASFAFPSFESGFAAIQEIVECGIRPSLMDFGEESPVPGKALLHLGLEGKGEIVRAEEKISFSICEKHSGAKLAHEAAERFWRERHDIARRFMQNRHHRRQQGSDGFYRDWIHVALLSSRVLAFRKTALEAATGRGLIVEECGLWTQPELFSMRLAAGDGPRSALDLQETIEYLLRLVQQMEGSIEYCHGVGIKLAPLMAEEHGCGLEVMRSIKRAIDPNGIMNPGKMGL